MSSFKTVMDVSEVEIVIKKSKFIGYITPVKNEEEAQSFIEKIKKQNYNANHNVPVYVIGEAYHIQRYSDDGEPSGTAAMPILDMLKKQKITNVCIVITRYFGGIKLGTGGLARAYTQAAKEAIEKGRIVDKIKHNLISFKFDYTYHGKIQNIIGNMEEIIVKDTIFLNEIELLVFVEEEGADDIVNKITEITSSKVTIESMDSEYLTFFEDKVII